MASYNYYLKDAKSPGETPIYLLFDDGVNRCKLYIQLSVRPKDWNPEKWEARKSFAGFSDFNEKLNKIQTKCSELHTALTKEGKFTLDSLKEKFRIYLDELNNRKKENTSGANKTFTSLSDFAKHYIDSVKSAKASNTILHNTQTLNLLKEFERGKKIIFDRVNLDFYNDFIEFLTRDKKYSPNTIGKHIANVKLFLNEATERGFNTKFDFKSKRFKTVSESVESIYLSEDELLKIYNHDFTSHKKLEHTRDLFIIGCFTGLRFSDFSQLKIENITDGQIKVKTQKTGETVVIPIHWTVKEILQKCTHTAKGLPRPYSNQKMNDYLKDVGEAVKISEKILHTHTKGGLKVQTTSLKHELMTTHTARRSFATNLFLSGFPAISIMKITGHKTEKSFMKYIKISQAENAKLLQLHWSEQVKLKVV
jgi:integrase